MFSALYITDIKGKILISRDYQNVTNSLSFSVSEDLKQFSSALQENTTSLDPILLINNTSFFNIQPRETDVRFVAAAHSNTNSVLVISFLAALCECFVAYFGNLSEEKVRDNFVLIYELLDEVCDFGFPQTTDPKLLKEYISQKLNLIKGVSAVQVDSKGKIKFSLPTSVKKALKPKGKPAKQPKLPSSVTNAVTWRQEGIKHKKNEVFLDVVEKLDILVSASGEVLSSQILGAIKLRTYLSGMPELKLGLNDEEMMKKSSSRKKKTVKLEDLKFHQCVRLARFQQDKSITFIPPDGSSQLLTYRIDTNNTKTKPLVKVDCSIDDKSSTKIELLLKLKSQFKSRSIANNVQVFIPVPVDAASPSFKTNIGTVHYVPDKDAICWKIRQLHGMKEYLMKAQLTLPASTKRNKGWKKPIKVEFEIPYFTVSGIQVRYLKIVEKSGYQALPWVRYITQNGDYQLRIV
eukprot:snap_masked-scaffold_1-processed-gene-25.26-mRNA-1 protein AED:0.00 eAED:0.01 QI:0/-1/0/1/-1/1/1/0/462